eukprot:PITA_10317
MLANHYEKKCYYCGKMGHIQRDCYHKKQADEARRRQVNPKRRGYFVEEDFSHEFRLFTVDCALSASNEDDIWYVDSGASSHMTGIKRLMAQVFEMKDLGSLHYCLGLEVFRDTGQTFLTEGKYARNLLEKFGMDRCRSAATPLQQNLKLSSDDGTKEVDATMYRQLVGSLIYLTTTRPDLTYSVSVLSQFMSKPLESHWTEARSVLRYLCGIVHFGILYTDVSDITLAGFSDSDWAGNLDDRRSITGYAFNIGSGVIAWSSKKQSTVALSSCEVEYQALCATTCEAIWLRRLLKDVRKEQKQPTSIKSDNQSTIKLAYNPVFHKNTKHIDTQFHFVRKKIQSNEIVVVYCKTCDNVADIFTKPLARVKFELFRKMLGVQENPFSIKGGELRIISIILILMEKMVTLL